MLAVGRELHLFDFDLHLGILNAKNAEGSFLVVLGIKEMNLLNLSLGFAVALRNILHSFFPLKETPKNHPGVIEAAGAGLGDADFANLLFVFPDSCRVVFAL